MPADSASGLSQLGVYAVTVVILAYACGRLWEALNEERKQSREDQARMLPALTSATEAMKSMVEIAARLASRNRGE